MPFKDKYGRICGFLDIDEDDKRKKFHRRYFILNKPNGVLEWYMDSPSNLSGNPQPCGTIKLDYITKVDEAKKMKIDFCFVINTPFRPYYVQANNQTELEDWVGILNDSSRIVVPPEALHPQACNEGSFESSNNDEANSETATSFTYRTEIVGNVVMKKKISESKLRPPDEQPLSPKSDSLNSDFKFPLSPTSPSLHSAVFQFNDDPEFIKKGWGVKQGHVRKNWKRRFFILKQQGFAYYKSEHDREPIRTIPIADILSAKRDDGELSRQRDNLFLVLTTDKPYYIQTDTPDEMASWISAFNKAIRKSSRQSSRKHQASRHKANDVANKSIASQDALLTSFASSSTQSLKKQTSAAQLACTPLQSGAVAYGSNTAPMSSQKRKTHRRGASDICAAHPSDAFEVMPIQISCSPPVAYDAEDVRARPESVNFSALSKLNWNANSTATASSAANKGRQSVGESDRRDYDVDTRSAIKPSAVKKKKHLGVMFSFNAMLSKKQDRIEKEKSRYHQH